jgi:hypothetical protein
MTYLDDILSTFKRHEWDHETHYGCPRCEATIAIGYALDMILVHMPRDPNDTAGSRVKTKCQLACTPIIKEFVSCIFEKYPVSF